MKFENIGVLVPDLLLPSAAIAPENWAVVACDQYSSEPKYWQEVETLVQDKASTYHMIFPEAYLDTADDEQLIASISKNMQQCIASEQMEEHKASLVLVKRQTSTGERRGVVLALDLEHYSYEKGVQSLIRATEGTIVDRLPPRIKVRRDAPLEFPHIMVLIDDPEKQIIEPLFDHATKSLYDFELMQKGGHIEGALVDNKDTIEGFAKKLHKLRDKATFQQKYQCGDQHEPLLFAMGDGNHSFATAKALWEELKTQQDFETIKDHPARYALVELVNLYDDSLVFEAIHRSVFNVNCEALLAGLSSYHQDKGSEVEFHSEAPALEHGTQLIEFCHQQKRGFISITNPAHQLATGSLQQFLDEYLEGLPEASLDYIHGDNTACQLAQENGVISFLLPAMNKHELFKTVIFDGALPRKTFSMGEAQDKRFYMEGRRIK
ncbi:Protein of unknown function [Alteromonadaceae bacterium Bs31]|nr:Protein of unknown function [Alteromonadaceae bacterium Bs31]